MRFRTAFMLGAGTAFFFDPRLGKRRRHILRDRSFQLLRRAGRLFGKARFAAGYAQGLAAGARSTVIRPVAGANDETVKRRILSNAFRHVHVSAGDLEVEVSGGVATLRGSLGSQTLADDLVERVRAVPGVREVTPLLTVAGQPTQW